MRLPLALALPWLAATTGHGAVSIYLSLDGSTLKGEARGAAHKGEIEIQAAGFQVIGSQTVGTTPVKASIEKIELFKNTDSSTPGLLTRLMKGGPAVPTGELKYYETIQDVEVPVLSLALQNIFFTSYEPSDADDSEGVTEKLWMAFQAFNYTEYAYVPKDGTTKPSGSVTWDFGTNSSGPNTAPTLSAIANQTVSEDAPLNLSFTVGDAETAAGALVLSVSSSNPQVIPLGGISFGGNGASRTAILTPAQDASGTAVVTFTVTDAGGMTTSQSFTVTVTPVNDPPSIQAIQPQTMVAGATLQVPLSVSDVDTLPANVTVSATSDNSALLPPGSIQFSGNGASTVMTIRPAANVTGTANVTLVANDGSLNSTAQSLQLTVTPPEGPALSDLRWAAGATPQLPENSPGGTVVGSLAATDSDTTAVVSFSLTNSAGGSFTLSGPNSSVVQVADGAKLDYETAPIQTIGVRASDNKGHTLDRQLTILLTNVNEPPVISTGTVAVFASDSTGPVTGLSIADPDAGTAAIQVAFSVPKGLLHFAGSSGLTIQGNDTGSVSVTGALASLNAALSSGALTYSSTGVVSGDYVLTITANDQGNSGSGGPQIQSAAVTLSVKSTPFLDWQRKNFSASQLADPVLSGVTGDPDGDGIANLLEYGVGSDPNNSNEGVNQATLTQVTVDGNVYPAIRYRRLRESLDPSLRIDAEIATDDLNWRSQAGDFVVVNTTSIDESRDEIVVRSSRAMSSVPRQLIRLRFSLQQ